MAKTILFKERLAKKKKKVLAGHSATFSTTLEKNKFNSKNKDKNIK
jgi:hypothetical protein